MGKDYKEEIEKACRHMNEILNKQNQTAQEVDAAHHYAEIVYYLTTAGAMNKAENNGMYMDGQSGRMMPNYDYSMENQSMMRGGRSGIRGGRGRGSYNDGYSMNDGYSERDMRGGQSIGNMPRNQYDWENDEYPNRR